MNRQNGNKSPAEGVIFGLFSVLFMVYWTYAAIKGGAPIIFWAFGLLGLYTTVRNTINQYKKLKQYKNSSQYEQYIQDIAQDSWSNTANSADPWDKDFRGDSQEFDINPACGHIDNVPGNRVNFCPYCGTQPQPDHDFCRNCGRQLPD